MLKDEQFLSGDSSSSLAIDDFFPAEGKTKSIDDIQKYFAEEDLCYSICFLSIWNTSSN